MISKKFQRLSVIIPVLNEEENMESIQNLIETIHSPNIPYEIIFVDGGSQDRTVDLLQSLPVTVIDSDKGRGIQLIAGVKASNGDAYVFLHADSKFDVSPLPQVVEGLKKSDLGCFRLKFDSPHFLLRLIAWGSNWRVRYRRIIFGDQGLFLSRDIYQKIGGFKPLPLMEDYDFSRRAKALNLRIYQSHQLIQSSSRYFQKVGILKSLCQMQYCQRLYRKGGSIKEIQEVYQQRR